MSKAVLKVVDEAMTALGINYEFGEWTSHPVYPYFVGEYQEVPGANEDGMQETTFLLTGFHRGKWSDLENEKEKICAYFGKVGGHTVTTDKGSAVAVFYSNSFIVPTGDMQLKRIEINLTIKEWSVK